MRKLVQIIVVGLFCGGAAAGAVFLVLAATNPDRQTSYRPRKSAPGNRAVPAAANGPAMRDDEDLRRKITVPRASHRLGEAAGGRLAVRV